MAGREGWHLANIYPIMLLIPLGEGVGVALGRKSVWGEGAIGKGGCRR